LFNLIAVQENRERAEDEKEIMGEQWNPGITQPCYCLSQLLSREAVEAMLSKRRDHCELWGPGLPKLVFSIVLFREAVEGRG
jgi:hypothetical protein